MAGALVLDSVCRRLVLGDRFAELVRAISAELDGAPVAGCEGYGELALRRDDLSGFHGGATVVLVFPK